MTTGNLVKLKSGGVTMTVRRIIDERASLATGYAIGIHCEWHDAYGTPHSQAYDADQLKEVLR